MSAVGRALSVLNRLAGSELIDKMGLRGPAQAMAYRAVKNGYSLGDAAAKRFKSLTQLAKAEHLPPAATRELFDLTFTEEQEMIRDSAGRSTDCSQASIGSRWRCMRIRSYCGMQPHWFLRAPVK